MSRVEWQVGGGGTRHGKGVQVQVGTKKGTYGPRTHCSDARCRTRRSLDLKWAHFCRTFLAQTAANQRVEAGCGLWVGAGVGPLIAVQRLGFGIGPQKSTAVNLLIVLGQSHLQGRKKKDPFRGNNAVSSRSPVVSFIFTPS